MSYCNQELNSLIYMQPPRDEPTRYQMVRYSTWRIYLFQQLQAMAPEKITAIKDGQPWLDKYPNLITTNEQKAFYSNFFQMKNPQILAQDVTSHFISRMLYCHDSANHSKFIEMEKLILTIKLDRGKNLRVSLMDLLKQLLGCLLNRKAEEFDVPAQDWRLYMNRIIGKDVNAKKLESIKQFAIIPIEHGAFGLKKRFSYVRAGNVYLNVQNTMDVVINLYGNFLRQKLQKMQVAVIEMLNNDVENQMNAFLRKTLDTLNTTNFDDTLINNQFKLNIKNVDALWKRFFPPCMLNLNQRLKQSNHLKHEGRRQLWLFLKGCGMDVTDNQTYFSRHMGSKVSASDMKSHLYNIQHAYGLVGKKQPQRPKNCRNIITGPAPKKDEHHGCPFAHWNSEHLKEYLRKNYNVSQVNLEEIIKVKDENHFQVACGRLFEGVAKSEGNATIPSQITNMLAKSPHEYFQAGMQLVNHNNNKGQDKGPKKPNGPEKQSIEF